MSEVHQRPAVQFAHVSAVSMYKVLETDSDRFELIGGPRPHMCINGTGISQETGIIEPAAAVSKEGEISSPSSCLKQSSKLDKEHEVQSYHQGKFSFQACDDVVFRHLWLFFAPTSDEKDVK